MIGMGGFISDPSEWGWKEPNEIESRHLIRMKASRAPRSNTPTQLVTRMNTHVSSMPLWLSSMNSMPDCSRIEPPAEPKTDKDGSQTKAAKQGWELFPVATERIALRGNRKEGSGGGGRDRMVSGGGPNSKQSPTQAAILLCCCCCFLRLTKYAETQRESGFDSPRDTTFLLDFHKVVDWSALVETLCR